jgi:hypothetical protein
MRKSRSTVSGQLGTVEGAAALATRRAPPTRYWFSVLRVALAS